MIDKQKLAAIPEPMTLDGFKAAVLAFHPEAGFEWSNDSAMWRIHDGYGGYLGEGPGTLRAFRDAWANIQFVAACQPTIVIDEHYIRIQHPTEKDSDGDPVEFYWDESEWGEDPTVTTAIANAIDQAHRGTIDWNLVRH